MLMRLRNETKVGLIVSSGIAVLIAIYWFLGGISLKASTYLIYAVFRNAEKLDRGAPVRMAGVKVGIVSDTCLTKANRARVNMLVDKGINIPDDSRARVTTGGFIGENYVDISPGTSREMFKHGQRIASEAIIGPEQILKQVGTILKELHESTRGINRLVGDPVMAATVKDTMRALNEAAKSASDMAKSAGKLVADASPEVQRILGNLAHATQGAERMSAQLQEMIASDVRPGVRSAMKDARGAAERLNASMTEASQLMEALKASGGKVNLMLDRFGNAAAEAEDTMTYLKDASAGVKEIATDKEIKENIKKAIKNAADASEQLNELVTDLNRKYGAKKSISPDLKAAVPDYGVRVNNLWDTNRGNYRFDANYTFLTGGTSFARLGAYNIGNNTRANLQGGMLLGGRNALRYGLYASRVGFGLDTGLGGRGLLSADLFNPNDLQLELRGTMPFSQSFGLYAGVADLLDPDNRDALVGLQYRK